MDLKQGIYFHYLVAPFYFPNRNLTKRFLQTVFKKYKKNIATINFIFCSDKYLLALNQAYLTHDTYTDIITFELNGIDEPILADVYISIDRVKANAAQFKVSFKLEILRLLIHGTLHLCGFTDKKKENKFEMTRLEDKYLDQFLFHVKRSDI